MNLPQRPARPELLTLLFQSIVAPSALLVIGREGKVRMDHGATEPGPAESRISKK